VALTWSAPGDDGWNNALSSGTYRIDYATYTKIWSSGDYKIEIATENVSPGDSQTLTVTGLTGGVSYYFRIWTADENSNWSEVSNASTACIVKIIGISVSPSAYDYGGLAVSSCVVNTTTITVRNDGNLYETYSIFSSSASNSGGGTGWTIDAVNPQTPGNNLFSLSAGFYEVKPSTDSFNTEAAESNKEDALLETTQEATGTKFSIAGAQTQTGAVVPKTETRNLWLLLKTPTEVSTRAEKTITVTITAEESP